METLTLSRLLDVTQLIANVAKEEPAAKKKKRSKNVKMTTLAVDDISTEVQGMRHYYFTHYHHLIYCNFLCRCKQCIE
jgi:oligoribonuclease (3'-5' exoribonuclease)